MQLAHRRVDHVAVLKPNSPFLYAVGDLEHRATLGKTFQLDDVHQALALQAAKDAVRFLAQQGFEAIHEQVDFLRGPRFFKIDVHAHRVGARAELFVGHGGQDRSA